MMKKRVFVSISVILLAAAALWGVVFTLKCRSFQPDVPQAATLDNTSPVKVGESVVCRTQISLPWFSSVKLVRVESGKYAVASGDIRQSISDRGLFVCRRDIALHLTAVEPGVTGNANFTVAVKTPGRQSWEYTCTVPEFTVSEPTGKNIPELQLADREIAPSQKAYWKYAVAVLSVLAAGAIILGAVYFFKMRRKSRQMSEWEKAKRDIELLQSDIELNRITPHYGFIRLTDLVRGYLEKRFGLPATRSTTQEFLDNISSRSEEAIPEPSKPFLKNFLTAADQIKFARASADTTLLKRAVSDASDLIDSTCPAEENKNV